MTLIDGTARGGVGAGVLPGPDPFVQMAFVDQALNDLSDAASMACWAYIRRAVRNGKGVVTELGRRSRLFRGSSRDAGLLLQDRCVWPGCDRPVRICQADHSVERLQRLHRSNHHVDDCSTRRCVHVDERFDWILTSAMGYRSAASRAVRRRSSRAGRSGVFASL